MNIDGGGNTVASVLIYNNTMRDCGAQTGSNDYGAIALCGGNNCTIPIKLINNIISQATGERYFSINTVNHVSCSSFTGSSNNILYGLGANSYCTAQFANTLNADPSFVSTATPDFHLASSGSPANGSGTATGASTYDFVGLLRPSPPARGAYEYAAATPASGGTRRSGNVSHSGKVSQQ